MKINKKIAIILLAIVIVFILAGSVYAYFSGYTTVIGRFPLELGLADSVVAATSNGNETSLNVNNNKGFAQFFRVKVITVSTEQVTCNTANMTLGNDGYYYYNSVVQAGQTIPNLKFNFNSRCKAVYIIESTEALYYENGTAYANWNKTIR